MKSWIGEYGKIAAMAIILAVLFAFVWNRTDRGYLGALSKAEPKSFLKATDNSDFLVQLKPRPDPVLTVSLFCRTMLCPELLPKIIISSRATMYMKWILLRTGRMLALTMAWHVTCMLI